MRFFFTILLFVGFQINSLACTCVMVDVKKAYDQSAIIFYGRHLGSKLSNTYNIMGVRQEFDDFEVIRFYKGVDQQRFLNQKENNSQKKYIISLVRNCGDNCSPCFDSTKTYLVYVSRDFISGQLMPLGCFRTRSIINNNFIIDTSFDPDYKKDESKLLEELKQADTLENDIQKIEASIIVENKLLKEKFDEGKNQLKRLHYYLYGLGLIIMLIIGIIHLYRKKRALQ